MLRFNRSEKNVLIITQKLDYYFQKMINKQYWNFDFGYVSMEI